MSRPSCVWVVEMWHRDTRCWIPFCAFRERAMAWDEMRAKRRDPVMVAKWRTTRYVPAAGVAS